VLFNSYSFLFVFLPIALIGYQIAGTFHRKFVIAWLGFASLAFYACWRPAFLILLLSSIAMNYIAGALISRNISNPISSRFWLILAIVLNLSLLCYFKYLFPSLNFISSAVGSSRHWENVILPLGISFFTFTQIAFLVDLHQGIAKQQDISSYLLFVTFFPHLIAGPILHHKNMMPQFQQERRYKLDLSDLAVGFSWFIMGLAKKVLFADQLAKIADPIFNAQQPLSTSQTWIGALSYCLQLYFDFSGYSDMALGLARMFSINFPLNFDSPLKASSILDFWQRWHMTLSQYIMSYLYTPIQLWIRAKRIKRGYSVSRKDMSSPAVFISMVAIPMMTTMFIAGIWHGAGLQFIVFGSLHGLYMTVNHAWRILFHKRIPESPKSPFTNNLKNIFYTLLTFFCVVISQVFFRARSLSYALYMLASMFTPHRSVTVLTLVSPARSLLLILIGLIIVWFLPNTQQILSRFQPSLQESAWDSSKVPKQLLWAPNTVWGLSLGVLFFIVLFQMQDPSTFLYFQF